MPAPELIVDYAPRRQFDALHDRTERFACIVTHRRAGKTVACINDLQRAAIECPRIRPRFAYLSPFLKQSKTVAWDYLRSAMAPLRKYGARVHETELRVDYPKGGQVRLYGADNPDALRGIYLDGIVLDEYADVANPPIMMFVPVLHSRRQFLANAAIAARASPRLYCKTLRNFAHL
jgi:phage terminase large subunit